MTKHLCIMPMLFLLCIVVGCQNRAVMTELEKYKAQAALEEQNNALALRFTDVYQKGDIAAIKEICSPDFIEHGVGQTFSLEQVIEILKG
ncbi:MAG: hypothetical protein ACXW2V_03380, partial [Candidatus Aminicenantales bacterium]